MQATAVLLSVSETRELYRELGCPYVVALGAGALEGEDGYQRLETIPEDARRRVVAQLLEVKADRQAAREAEAAAEEHARRPLDVANPEPDDFESVAERDRRAADAEIAARANGPSTFAQMSAALGLLGEIRDALKR